MTEVTLVEPKIVLEINAEGKPNWEFAPSVGASRACRAEAQLAPAAVARQAHDRERHADLQRFQGGPVDRRREGRRDGVGRLDRRALLGGRRRDGERHAAQDRSQRRRQGQATASPTSLALEAGGGKLGFKGTISELGPNARLTGLASASAESLTRLRRHPRGPRRPAGAGDAAAARQQVQLRRRHRDVADPVRRPRLQDGAGRRQRLGLDRRDPEARAGRRRQGGAAQDRPRPGAGRARARRPRRPPRRGKPAPPAAPTTSGGASVLDALTAKVSIEAAEVLYNKQPVRNVAIELDAKGGTVAVPKLAATLPGDMVLQARSTMSGDPARPTVSRRFQPGRAQAARDARLAGGRRLVGAGQQADPAQPEGPARLERRQRAGQRRGLRARRRQGHRRRGRHLLGAAVDRDPARDRHDRSRFLPRQAGRRPEEAAGSARLRPRRPGRRRPARRSG